MSAPKADLIRSLRLDRVGDTGAASMDSIARRDLDRMPKQARNRTWLVAGWLASLVAVAGLGYWFSSDASDEASEAQTTSPSSASAVTAATTSEALPSSGLTASGYVVARRQATVAAEITGRLIDVRIEEGQQVRQGDVLALLDSNLAESDLLVAQGRRAAITAQIDGARAAMSEAEEAEGRIKALFDRGFSTRADLARAEARVASERSTLAAANANMGSAAAEEQRARLQIARHVIRAPFSGLVIGKNAQAGEIISPVSAGAGFTRTGIGTLVDISSIEVEVDVSERHVSRIVPGQPVSIQLVAYPERKFAGSVIAIVPAADRNRSTFRVRIRFNAIEDGIFPEMAAQVGFLSPQTRKDK